MFLETTEMIRSYCQAKLLRFAYVFNLPTFLHGASQPHMSCENHCGQDVFAESDRSPSDRLGRLFFASVPM